MRERRDCVYPLPVLADLDEARNSITADFGHMLPAAIKALAMLQGAASNLHRCQMAARLLHVEFPEACAWVAQFDWGR